MPNSSVDALKFKSPPVRSVDLTLYFSPLAELKVSSLLARLGGWGDKYSLVSEGFALPPVEQGVDQSSYFPLDGGFPFPWLVYGDESGHRLGFQNDRFSLYWEFEDGREYEGFQRLERELFAQFEGFCEAVSKVVGTAPKVTRAEAEYTNKFEQVDPMAVASQFLYGFSDPEQRPSTAPSRYAFHASAPVNLESGVETNVEVSAAYREGESIMWIDSIAQGSPDAPADPRLLMSHAHRELLKAFLASTNSSQHAEWGRE